MPGKKRSLDETNRNLPVKQAAGGDAQLSDLEKEPIYCEKEALFAKVYETDEDDDAWRQQLEDLKRRRRQEIEEGRGVGAFARKSASPSGQEFAELIRAAVRGASWAEVTSPAVPPKPHAVVEAVRCLHEHEVLELLRVCASRYETHVRERSICSIWIMQVLELRCSSLIGKPELRLALGPFFRKLTTRLGSIRRGGLASCVGKWKLVRAMAYARKREALVDESTTLGEEDHEDHDDHGSEEDE